MKSRINLVLVVLLCLMASCTQSALDREGMILDVKSISFDQTHPVWFGGKQDIMVSNLPDSVVGVQYNPIEKSYHWSLRNIAYFKINGKNPNLFSLDSIQQILISDIVISHDMIIQNLESLKKESRDEWHYIRLVDLYNKIYPNRRLEANTIRSVVAYNNGGVYLILLDNSVRVITNTQTPRGVITEGNINASEFKLEFFTVNHSAKLMSKKRDLKNSFFIQDTLYSCHVKSLYTPFGANEITIKKSGDNDSILVSFNKVFRALIPTQLIDTLFKKNDNIALPIKQLLHANPFSNEIYTPNISNPENRELASLNSPLQCAADRNQLLYNGVWSHYSISWVFLFLGFLPLTLIFVLGLVFIKNTKKEYLFQQTRGEGNGKIWQEYLISIYKVLYILGLGRIFIGYNLSFTPPFFPVDFQTAVLVAPLVQLNVLLIWLFLLESQAFSKKSFVKFIIWTGLIVAISCFALAKFHLFDYYWDNFDINWNNFSFSKEWLRSFKPFVHTIRLLIALVMVNSFFVIVKKYNKVVHPKFLKIKWHDLCFFIIEIFILIALFFGLGKNAYSAGLLLVSIFVLYAVNKQHILNQYILTFINKLQWKHLEKLAILVAVIVVILFISKISGYKNIVIATSITLAIVVILIKQWELIKMVVKPLIILVSIVLVYVIITGDFGYFINIIGVFAVLTIVVSSLQRTENIEKDAIRNATIRLIIGSATFIIFSIGAPYVFYKGFFETSEVSGRTTERLTAMYDFDKIMELGDKNSESIGQFFAILSKYAYPTSGKYDCYDPAHPGISGFVDPVVENDLSAPFALIYQFGSLWWLCIVGLLLLWGFLLFKVIKSFTYQWDSERNKENNYNKKQTNLRYFSSDDFLRLYCVSMLVGSGIYLVLSYFSFVPFTGRLIFGLGQDSIAEVFETIVLFSCIGFVSKKRNSSVVKS